MTRDRELRLGEPDVPLRPVDGLDTLELLAVGYAKHGVRPRVRRLTIDHWGSTNSDEHGFQQRPMATVPHRPQMHAGTAEHTGMPADLVDQHFDHSHAVMDAWDPEDDQADYPAQALADAYVLRGLSLLLLRDRVLAGLEELITSDRAPFDTYGVGGTWAVVELRPGSAPVRSTAALGPWMPQHG